MTDLGIVRLDRSGLEEIKSFRTQEDLISLDPRNRTRP